MKPNKKQNGSHDNDLSYKLLLIQTIIFVIPCFALSYFLYQNDVLLDVTNAIVFLSVLGLILGGFLLLRQILDRVADLAVASQKIGNGDYVPLKINHDSDELNQISSSINSLLERVEESTATANARFLELLCIKEFSEAVKQNRSRQTLARLLLEKAMSASGATKGAVFLKEDPMSDFNLIDARGENPALPEETGQPVYDLVSSEEFRNPGHGTLAAPLMEQDRLIGLVVVADKKDGTPFSEHDRNVLTIMTDHLSTECEAGHLDSELQQRVNELDRQTKDLEAEIIIRQETEEKLRNILESSSAISIVSTDLDQKILYWNKGAENIFGFQAKEMVGEKITKIYADDEQSREILSQARNKVIENGNPASCEVRELSKEGTDRWVRLNLSARMNKDKEIVGILGIGEDVSERKRLEQMLMHAEKMRAIGTLAGGVAHDFNNILTSIRAYSELALFRISDLDAVRDSLDQIMNASERARDLVKQILNFSRQQGEEKKPIRLDPIIKETVKLLEGALPATIEVATSIKPDKGIINADPTKIHQVLMNLGTNAAHAMNQDGGILTIILSKETLNQKESMGDPDLKPGDYMRIRVHDTGCGMTPEVLEHIFEPYYTTREIGEGSGMGLAVVYGIVKQHGGGIMVYSKPNKGTVFDVFFPIADSTATEDPHPSKAVQGGQESILFVDDEMAVTKPYIQILKDLGYAVTGFTDSLAALEHFKTHPHKFDLVICDMTMPQITGEALAREIKNIRSDIPVIICTGYSESMSPEKARTMGIDAFLPKPLAISDLASTIRRTLREGNARSQAPTSP